MHLAPGVEITLLKKNFGAVKVAVVVAMMPSKGNKFSHMVMQVQLVSDLFGWTLQIIMGYVTLLVANGASGFKMEWMVFVSSILLPLP